MKGDIICHIRGKKLSNWEKRQLSEQMRNLVFAYDLDYVFLCKKKPYTDEK